MSNPRYHVCKPVALHSYGLVNNTNSTLQVHTSAGACVGDSIDVSPGEKTNSTFTSFMALG
ncbi:hypothetical protein ACIRRH_34690 [Kitasatospora sp. NPDC101235]|uniref:hypothetical protein n=1 Tax=Kitasatospora sp. NPDC101235 TaxID=3364101 RepID=UPI003827C009